MPPVFFIIDAKIQLQYTHKDYSTFKYSFKTGKK